jgi:hypothetical protein
MSFMFELYCKSPEDAEREARIVADVVAAGGRLDYREPADREGGPIVLTFEFESREQAETIADVLRQRGEHVEGVSDYA